jgi:hypothetical protein
MSSGWHRATEPLNLWKLFWLHNWSGRRQQPRIRTLLLALFLVLVQQTSTSATDVVNGVGSYLADVTRGGGNVLGQGISGLAGPTINDFAEVADSVVSKILGLANNLLAERITQIDRVAQARIAQIDLAVNRALNQLNSQLNDAITQMDKILDEKIGTAQVVVQRAMLSFEDVLLAVIFYTVAIIFTATVGYIVARRTIEDLYSGSLKSKRASIAVAAAAAASVLVVLALYALKIPLTGQLLQLATDLQSNTLKSYRAASLNDAVRFAKQLSIVEPNNIKFQALEKLTEIQRDVLYRPTVMKSPLGAFAFQSRIGQLAELVTSDAIKNSKDEISEFIKIEADASTAVILWQLGQGLQNGQIEKALCAAASSGRRFWLKNKNSSNGDASRAFVEKEATPFIWLISRYLKWGSFIYGDSDPPLNCQSGLQSVSFQSEARNLKDMHMVSAFDAAEKPSSISHIIHFDDYALEYFEKASYLYTATIVADANFEATNGDTKSQYLLDRNKWADQLIDWWTKFTRKIASDTSISSNDISVASIGLPAALAIRAQMIRNIPSGGIRSRALTNFAGKDDVEYSCDRVISLITPDPSVTPDPPSPEVRKTYEHFKPLPIPGVPGGGAPTENVNAIYSLALIYKDPRIRFLICAQQIALDAKFADLERKLADDRRSRSLHDANTAKLVENLPGPLAVCINPANNEPSGDLEPFDCDPKTSGSFVRWIEPGRNTVAQRYAMVR